ncbi:MAG: outer membrane beta-barrel protein, partial [Chitinophagaceae bacterium]
KEKTYQAWYGVTEEDLHLNRKVNYAGTERPGSPYDNETDNYQQDHYQLFYNHQLGSSLTFQTALYYTAGKGYYEQYKADQFFSRYQLTDVVTSVDTIRKTDLIRQLWLDNQLIGQTFSVLYKKKTATVTLGGGWNTYHGHHFGEVIWATLGIPDHYRWYDLKAVKTDLNLYTKYQQTLGKGWEAFAELQFRKVDYRIDGFRDNPGLRINVSYPFLNPKLGFSYTQHQTRWYLSYAVGQKEPNRDDFEANPQQQPLPEFLHDWEAGVEHKSRTFFWSVGGYFMNYRNQLVLTGKINDVGAYTRTNIRKSYRLGAEVQGTLTLTPWLKCSGNITVSDNRIVALTEYIDDYDAGGQKDFYYHRSQLAFSPAVTSNLSLAVQPFAKAQLTWNSSYTSRQYLDNTARRNRSLDPYWVQDVQFRYRIPVKFCKEWSVVLQVNNLFDTRYESNGYTYSYWAGGTLNTANYYYPMAGRHVLAALNFTW